MKVPNFKATAITMILKATAITIFLKAVAFYVDKRTDLSCREARFWHWLIQPVGKIIFKEHCND